MVERQQFAELIALNLAVCHLLAAVDDCEHPQERGGRFLACDTPDFAAADCLVIKLGPRH
jgi:hypothetical protein